MHCPHCGNLISDDAAFCPLCGKPTAAPAPDPTYNPQPPVSPLYQRTQAALGDGLFLAACILMSVGALLSFNVIHVLFAIFMWLLFAQSRKGIADPRYLRAISGTVFAEFVLSLVAVGSLAFCGVFFIFGLSNPMLIETLKDSLGYLPAGSESYAAAVLYVLSVASWLIGAGFLLAAGICLVISLCGVRKVHQFFKGLYTNLLYGQDALPSVDTAAGWILVFGIFAAIAAVFSWGGGTESVKVFLGDGCRAAALIIVNRLLVKHFR